MNVTTDDIRKLRPGEVKTFFCEMPEKCSTAKSIIGAAKRKDYLREGVVDIEYHTTIIKGEGNAIVVRALGEGDSKVFKLRKSKKS